jgi:branched-chain amino acid aminotransferase
MLVMLQTYNATNANLIVNINGELVHRDRAGVSPFDSSVQNGDAVWEGLRLYQGRIFRLRQHLDRLRRGAELLAYQGVPSDARLIEQLARTLQPRPEARRGRSGLARLGQAWNRT